MFPAIGGVDSLILFFNQHLGDFREFRRCEKKLVHPKNPDASKKSYFEDPGPCYTGSFTLPLEGPTGDS